MAVKGSSDGSQEVSIPAMRSKWRANIFMSSLSSYAPDLFYSRHVFVRRKFRDILAIHGDKKTHRAREDSPMESLTSLRSAPIV